MTKKEIGLNRNKTNKNNNGVCLFPIRGSSLVIHLSEAFLPSENFSIW